MYERADFGTWLHERRRELDLTQEELAERVGCSRDLIKKIELGQRRPSRQMAELLAERLTVPAEQRPVFVQLARGIDSAEHFALLPSPVIGREMSIETSGASPNNLPAQITPFIGRKKDLADLIALLQSDNVRMVTLTGPGGIGKTRLALRVAEELLASFQDGVFFVSLAPISEPDFVVASITKVLQVHEVSNQPLPDSLKQFLHKRNLLLVLDNFEHMIGLAPTVAELLLEAPNLKVLVTSRELLHIRAEHHFPVPPLTLPDRVQPGPASVEQLVQSEAVCLFVERSAAVKPDFVVTNENASIIAKICMRLDGLPLALELAAARSLFFSPQTILSKLEHSLALLVNGPQDLPARQRTLRNTIEWSYDLLSEGERQLFRQMAVFRGGLTLEALQMVCNYKWRLQVNVLEGVESLVSKSLLQQREGLDGEPRFWMLESIREYAELMLSESGEGTELQRAHALYYMRLAEEAEPQVRGPRQMEWLDQMEEEHDNFRAALAWVRRDAMVGSESDPHQLHSVDIGLRLVGALHRFWLVRNHYNEGREQIRAILNLDAAKAGPPARRTTRGRALLGEALLVHLQGQFKLASVLKEEALEIFQEIGDKQGIAAALLVLAGSSPDPEERRSELEESCALFEEAGDTWNLARALNQFAQLAYLQGDFGSARRFIVESLTLAQQAGDTALAASCLKDAGRIATGQGDYDSACCYFERSLALYKQVRDKWGAAVAQINLVEVALMQGNITSMRSLVEELLATFREVGSTELTATSLLYLARIALIEGDKGSARRLLEESLHVMSEGGPYGVVEATVLRFLGHVAKGERDARKADELYRESLSVRLDALPLRVHEVAAGALAALGGLAAAAAEVKVKAAPTPERATRLLGAAQALIEATGHPLPWDERIAYERSLVIAQTQMGNEVAWRVAWEEGRAMSMEQAIACAQGEQG